MTSATFNKARSTAAVKAYEIASASDSDTRATLPNDFGTKDVLVQIEPLDAGRPLPADYLASYWRISDETTAEEIVLTRPFSAGAKAPQVAFVSVIVPVPVPDGAPANKPLESRKAPKAKAPKAKK